MVNRFQWLRRLAKGKVLEVGCGDAVTFLNQDNIEWYGVDKYLKDEWIPNLEGRNFTVCDGYNLNEAFEPETFDTLVYAEVLEHVPTPKYFLQHGLQFLKPGGRVLITIPDEHNWAEGLGKYENPDHLWYFDEEAVRFIVDIEGLHIAQFIHTPMEWNRGFVFWMILLVKVK